MDKYAILKTYFGYEDFRHRQADMIDAVLNGGDVLGVMPTGAGKSLCYQVPAMLFSGVTLIVSPLIALMKDQVSALTDAGVPAAFLNTSLTESQYHQVIDGIIAGRYKLIYVAPERLAVPRFREICRDLRVDFIAVDEAHCVSQWGHDFRSAYLAIGDFIATLPRRPIIGAYTATATENVRADIIKLLGLEDPTVFVSGFDRPNLFFDVRQPKGKFDELLRILKEHQQQSGIIYCSTRKQVEEVCQRLSQRGAEVTRYHAGLSDKERKQNQEDFVFDRKPLMVATNAFGMGIDKSNVSFVVHYNMPKNIESYYQEAGRAGRDGEPADCILLFEKKDVVTNRFLIDNGGEELEPELRAAIRENELRQLRQMTAYATSTGCLRRQILAYFGKDPGAPCGDCGNCSGDFSQEDRTAETRIVIDLLRRLHHRFGLNMIADILGGAKTKRLLELGLNDLDAYGAMKEQKRAAIRELLDALLEAGYLAVSDGDYPTVGLTKKCRPVVEEGEAVILRRRAKAEPEPSPTPTATSSSVDAADDDPLFEVLRQKRKEIADKEGVPAYVVLTNAALRDMCRKRPRSVEALLDVNGIGKAKQEKYGDIFIALLNDYLAGEGESAESIPAVEAMEEVIPLPEAPPEPEPPPTITETVWEPPAPSPWSDKADQDLIAAVARGDKLTAIAVALGVSVDDAFDRLKTLTTIIPK